MRSSKTANANLAHRKRKSKRNRRTKEKWTLFYANARGISSKKMSLIDILGELKPQIALFTETMLNAKNGFQLEGYTFCGKSRAKRACGGVGILVKNELKHQITPHETDGDLELLWVSIKRKDRRPIFIGVYYGKQETRNNRNEMLLEMDKLSCEIHNKKNEGEVILFMDGNGKIGLLGEQISRNGELLLQLFNECDLEIMNKSEKCEGAVTRVNRTNPSEMSAIDFVLASEQVEDQIEKIVIDEKCDYVLGGLALTDHNSIIMNVDIENVESRTNEKITRWRLNAPAEKWDTFENALYQKSEECKRIMEQDFIDMDSQYGKWKSIIETQTLQCIGKTTIKANRKRAESVIIKTLRIEKREARRNFQNENDQIIKGIAKDKYIEKQIELRNQIQYELEEQMETRFIRMIEKGPNGFWREMKIIQRDELSNWISIKDENGQRILDPEKQKEIVANYYEELYSPDTSLKEHAYHEYVAIKIIEYSNNYDYEMEWYNRIPSKKEVEEAIKLKKNNKATTDIPNEILKRGGKGFVECFYPVLERFWNYEKTTKEWNEGIITSVWKGKGDQEKLKFQRGITVSSSISMIFEELINERMTNLIPLTTAQGGGRKGTSTRDHVFLLRGAITHAIKNHKEMYVTYYDVAKAYDRANVDDMLVTAWEHGLRGKLWRLMNNLNTNLTARIKLRQGMTREKNFGFTICKNDGRFSGGGCRR